MHKLLPVYTDEMRWLAKSVEFWWPVQCKSIWRVDTVEVVQQLRSRRTSAATGHGAYKFDVVNLAIPTEHKTTHKKIDVIFFRSYNTRRAWDICQAYRQPVDDNSHCEFCKCFGSHFGGGREGGREGRQAIIERSFDCSLCFCFF